MYLGRRDNKQLILIGEVKNFVVFKNGRLSFTKWTMRRQFITITVHCLAVNWPAIIDGLIAFQSWFRQFNFDYFLRNMEYIFWFATLFMNGLNFVYRLNFDVKFMKWQCFLPTFDTEITIIWFILQEKYNMKILKLFKINAV